MWHVYMRNNNSLIFFLIRYRYENVNESELEKLDYEKDKFNSDEDDEITGYPKEYRLELEDILPSNPSNYDKNRAPRMRNQPTLVDFHVTVLSIDSINEESMVRINVATRWMAVMYE